MPLLALALVFDALLYIDPVIGVKYLSLLRYTVPECVLYRDTD